MTIKHPSEVETLVFASEGLQFDSNSVFKGFVAYNQPHEHYRVKRYVDLSAFMPYMPPFPSNPPVKWPFTEHNVPLMGYVSVPPNHTSADAGPFPLVLFQHGNNGKYVDFAPGYQYLCELLASQGIIAASIAVWPLMAECAPPGWPDGAPRMGKRAIYTLECLKQFKAWNEEKNHPLSGKIDLNRVILVGHSTSGPDIGLASHINRLERVEGLPAKQGGDYPWVELCNGKSGLGPYGFGIKAIFSIEPSAPNTYLHELPYGYPDINVDYFSIDTDFRTRWQHDTANRVDPVTPEECTGLTARWDFLGGHHDAFNTTWPEHDTPLPAEQQRAITQLFVSTMAQAVLLEKPEALELLKDYRSIIQRLPEGVKFASQYHDPQRLYLQHNQETAGFPEAQVSAPFTGNVFTDAGSQLSISRHRVIYPRYAKKADFFLLALAWPTGQTDYRYTLELNGSVPGLDEYTVISMGFAPQPVDAAPVRESERAEHTELDFEMHFTGTDGHSVSVRVSEFAPLYYPDKPNYQCFQTIRVPLQRLEEAGILRSQLKSISWVFSASQPGALFCDGIAFSK